MVVKPQNLLVIMSDEHNPKVAGYARHPIHQNTGAGRARRTR
jgi:hypothetical protein